LADPKAKVVILGAGHAGGSAAAFLRQYGHEGPIVLIGDEPIAPYQRPPLSKAWLKGEADASSLALKDDAWYAENDCDLRLGVTAVSIDRAGKTVQLSVGGALTYDYLIIATGARARKLPIPGAELDGVLELRTAADAELLKAALGARRLGPDHRARAAHPRPGRVRGTVDLLPGLPPGQGGHLRALGGGPGAGGRDRAGPARAAERRSRHRL
jgi:NADPH-dependent 2,4-dienoyl-CoA reductase/sulfur reductase-like enzyme